PEQVKVLYKPKESERDAEEEEEPETCPHCRGTGYRGRTGIFELLVMTDRIRQLLEDKNINAIRQEALKNGMKLLQDDGLRQVIEGVTSIPELLRVAK